MSIILRIGNARIIAEVADTPPLWEKGLMDRKTLKPNHGMLFIFNRRDIQWFWMKNTYIPLDIAFLGDDGKILKITTMKPLNLKGVNSGKPCRYALEIGAGFFKRHSIKPGDRALGLERSVGKTWRPSASF